MCLCHLELPTIRQAVFTKYGTGGEVEAPSQAASSMTRLKGEVRVCSGISPLSQLIN